MNTASASLLLERHRFPGSVLEITDKYVLLFFFGPVQSVSTLCQLNSFCALRCVLTAPMHSHALTCVSGKNGLSLTRRCGMKNILCLYKQPMVRCEPRSCFRICLSFGRTNSNTSLWLKGNNNEKTLLSYKSCYLCSTTIGWALEECLGALHRNGLSSDLIQQQRVGHSGSAGRV